VNPDSHRVLIVEARFYEDVADALVKGASAVFEEAGIGVERIDVPGVFEIPAAMRYAIRAMEFGASKHHYAGFVSLGCVIRGETDHYEYICRAAIDAIMNLTINHSVAHGFGILTCENREQAWVRADVKQRNLGARAANACLRMMDIKTNLRLISP
jgi:6,7-dimethyl-8-ribityllumazine synthase